MLKYELYLDNDLSRFLLERALKNQRIGHYFFWYLRSEMHLADTQLRYGLLLEAYCRGCGGHMQVLQKQVDAIDQLLTIANDIKPKTVPKDNRAKLVQVRSSAMRWYRVIAHVFLLFMLLAAA